MKPDFVSKRIRNITSGLLNKISDFVFVNSLLLDEFIIYDGENLGKKARKINLKLFGFNGDPYKKRIYRAFYDIRRQGLINKELKITQEGQQRLDLILPQYYGKRKWDGYWYLVSYDIPERYSLYRKIFKTKLEDLKFGLLHKSVWISPFNFLGEVQQIVDKYRLYSFVFLSKSNQLNKPSPKIIAERIWRLNNINRSYEEFIKKAKSKKFQKHELIFKYLAILKKDPQFPEELLPDNWQGEEAFFFIKKFVKIIIFLNKNSEMKKND